MESGPRPSTPAPVSQSRALTGIVPLARAQGPEIGLGSCLPWEKAVARAGQPRGAGLALSCSVPPPPVHLGGGVGSWRRLLPGGSNMLRQLLLGCVYPTASLPGETIFEKQYQNLDPREAREFCRGGGRPAQARPPSYSPPSPSGRRAGTFPGRKSFPVSDLDPSCCDFRKSRLCSSLPLLFWLPSRFRFRPSPCASFILHSLPCAPPQSSDPDCPVLGGEVLPEQAGLDAPLSPFP